MESELFQRFWSRVLIGDDCWVWTGSSGSEGYGYLNIKKKVKLAHRVSYETVVGEIPTGLQLDHLCRNRRCVRPDHLEPVTRRENILRGQGRTAVQARQTHCKRGHPLSGENLYLYRGMRQCRKCRKDLIYRRRAEARAALLETSA